MIVNLNEILIFILISLIFLKYIFTNESFNNKLEKKSSCGCGSQIDCSSISVSNCNYTIGCHLDHNNNCVKNT